MGWPLATCARAVPFRFASAALRKLPRHLLQGCTQNLQLRYVQVKGADILLFGTTHLSKNDPTQICHLVKLVKPNLVAVELCHERLPKYLAAYGVKTVKALGSLADVSSKTDEVGLTAYGADTMTALQQAAKFDIQYALIDRPLGATAARLAATAKDVDVVKFWLARPWHSARTCACIIHSLLSVVPKMVILIAAAAQPHWLQYKWFKFMAKRSYLRLEEWEENTKNDRLKGLIEKVASIDELRDSTLKRHKGPQPPREDDGLKHKVILDERDVYMAHKLQMLASMTQGGLILAVVGMGHLEGLESNLVRTFSAEEIDQVSMKPFLPDAEKAFKRPFLKSHGFDLEILRRVGRMQQHLIGTSR